MAQIDSLKDFAAVIEAFGGPLAFASAIGIPASHARAMKTRNSIPADYWPKVVEAAPRCEPPVADVSFELLGRLRGALAQRRAS